jgi:hypothetical protein
MKSGEAPGSRLRSQILSLVGGEIIELINTPAMEIEKARRGDTGDLLLISTSFETMDAISILSRQSEV